MNYQHRQAQILTDVMCLSGGPRTLLLGCLVHVCLN